MIIERHEDERLAQPTEPERAEVVEIAGAVNEERGDLRFVLAIKVLDQSGWCRETKSRSPFTRVQRRQVAGQAGPGIIEVEVQSSKSL